MSNRIRRRYSQEFRAGAVEMATQPGATMAQVARNLGISKAALHEWMTEARGVPARLGAMPLRGPVSETERDELVRLRREITTLRLERDFLKKATAFFARESR